MSCSLPPARQAAGPGVASARVGRGEGDVRCVDGAAAAPRSALVLPVEVRVRDNQFGRRRPVGAEVLRGVRVRDEGDVVAADEGPVQGRADAGVGCAPATTSRPTRRSASTPRAPCPRRSRRRACGSAARTPRARAPARTASPTPFGRSSSECCTQMTGTSSARALPIRVLMLAITSSRLWAPATTPFWTSMTSSAGLGRSESVVMGNFRLSWVLCRPHPRPDH